MLFTALAFALLLQVQIHNNDNQPFQLQRIAATVISGEFPDEQAWQEIAPLPLVMYQPVHRGEMTENSVIKVAYDNQYLYVYGRLYDSEPDKIVANTLYRDRYSGDETFAIILDTFNDNENARWFFVTPTGVRVDMLVLNDSEGDNSINRDWNTFWDAKTHITDDGWFTEMRIPFSSLGFREINGEVIMGLIVYRYIARKAERHIFPDIPAEWSRGFAKPSQAQKIKMTGIQYKRPVYITPYLLGGFEQVNQLNQAGDAYRRYDSHTAEAGLDIRFPVSGNMNIDITLNTDFAQAEADEAQINLSRFPLFFPEKRRFFQERSDIFDFNLGGNNTLFYSRRIGLVQGRQVRILGGARLAGRTGKWDIGLMNMQTDALSSLHLSSENFGVYRLRRDLINDNSYAGGMVASRIGADGSYNIAAGFDLLYNYSGNDYLDLKYAATFDHQFDDTGNFFNNGILRLHLIRRAASGFYYRFTAKRAGEQYLPGMGFESRQNYTLFDLRLFYGHFNSPQSPLRIVTPAIRYFVSLRNEDNSVESMMAEQPWSLDFKDGSSLDLTASWWYEDLRDTLSFSEKTFVEPGSYSFLGLNLNYSMSSAKPLRTSISAGINTFYDGSQVSFSVNPTWNPSKHFEFGGSAQFNVLAFHQRDQKEHLNIFSVRSLIALNTRVSLQLLSQYNHLARQIGTNARFRYNFREGNDLWIVLNETTNSTPGRYTPPLPRFDNRVILVKYTHTFY